MKALVSSLNFNPGHFSHLVANYKLFEDLGFKPYLFINRALSIMDTNDMYDKVYDLKGFSKADIQIAVFWFPSLNNIIQIIKLKLFFKSRIIYVFHEPFDSFINYYMSGFGFFKICKIYLINLVNILTIFLSDSVVLPSNSAISLYKKKYKYFNKDFTLIPLMFDDESSNIITVEDKCFISYIGTVAADHAFDKFVTFAQGALQNKWFTNYTFLIATSSLIPQSEKNKLNKYFLDGKIVFSEGSFMSNETINNFYEKSVIVWNAYNRSMQSGVLPKSFMFGTPVLLLKKNANEFVDDNKNCILLESNSDINEIKEAINIILKNKVEFSNNCRLKFLSTFYYKSKIENFKKITE
jgi:glycosyltransferase involved in cell wall biosynthesis